MQKKSVETQELILKSAKIIFTKKGYAGARMQEIADEAGINKALLHYYYRSKEKLFDQIFDEALKKMLRPVSAFLADNSGLFEKIRNLCWHYNKVLQEYPFLPNFVMNEINTDASRVVKLMKLEGMMEGMQKTLNQIKIASQEGLIREIDPRELIVNIVSLSIFPFIMKPIGQELLYNDQDMDKVLSDRADRVADFVINSIKI